MSSNTVAHAQVSMFPSPASLHSHPSPGEHVFFYLPYTSHLLCHVFLAPKRMAIKDYALWRLPQMLSAMNRAFVALCSHSALADNGILAACHSSLQPWEHALSCPGKHCLGFGSLHSSSREKVASRNNVCQCQRIMALVLTVK